MRFTWTWCWEVAHHRSQTDTQYLWPAAPELHLPPEDPQVSAERSAVSSVKEIQHYRCACTCASHDQVCGQDFGPVMKWSKYLNHTVAQLINVQIKAYLELESLNYKSRTIMGSASDLFISWIYANLAEGAHWSQLCQRWGATPYNTHTHLHPMDFCSIWLKLVTRNLQLGETKLLRNVSVQHVTSNQNGCREHQ